MTAKLMKTIVCVCVCVLVVYSDTLEASDAPPSANIDIKQEENCDSPGAPLPPHAASKIQVCS